MEFSNCSLQEKESFLEIQELILPMIFSNKTEQLAALSLVEIKGTPGYRTGKQPSFICKRVSI